MKPMLRNFLAVFILLLNFGGPPSWAWQLDNDLKKLGKVTKQALQETGKAAEKGLQKIGDVGADVITLGENGRRRDRERAEHQLALAQQEKAQAEAMRLQTLKSLQIQLSDAKTILELTRRFNNFLTQVEALLKANIQNSILAAELQGTNSLAFLTQQEIVKDQYLILENWLNQMLNQLDAESASQKSHIEQYRIELHKTLSNYVAQFDRIEKVAATDVKASAIDQLFVLGFQALQIVEKESIVNQQIIDSTEKSISSLQEQVQQLQPIQQ
jgi:hypothetical protein